MPSKPAKQSEFGLRIQFDKQSDDPARVFRAMSDLVETCKVIDRSLVQSIHVSIEPVLFLEDVRGGSVVAWFRNEFQSNTDLTLKGLNAQRLTQYLVDGKYALVDFVQRHPVIAERQQIDALQQTLFDLVQQSGIKQLPIYTPVDRKQLLCSISKLQDALANFQENDCATYLTPDREVAFNRELSFDPESADDLLARLSTTSTQEMILKVKKPDYLGESKWEFRHGTTKVEAKIVDTAWLRDFHHRRVDIRPGDSLRVNAHILVRYGFDNEVLSTHYTVTKVLEVMQCDRYEQIPLLACEG